MICKIRDLEILHTVRHRTIGIFTQFIFAITFVSVTAQEQLLNRMIPSPQAAVLDKFNEVPVDLYTGVPNISIPLYTISSYDLEIPINLSHHASGLKIQEYSPWTGMNWALSSGGVVTREVRGRDDFGYGGYYYNWARLPLATDLDYKCDSQETSYVEEIYDLETGFLDGEADLYHVNLYNHSGSFTISRGEVVNLKNDGAKYEIITDEGPLSGLPKFKATLLDGTKYYFGGISATENHQIPNPVYRLDVPYAGTQFISYNNDFDYPISFYLTRIETKTGRTADFDYTSSQRITYDGGQHETRIDYAYTGDGSCTDVNNIWDNIQTHYELYPSRIYWEGGTVIFESNFNRCDLIGAKRLTGFKVFNKEGKQVNSFSFNYSYDMDSDDFSVCDASSNRSKKRLWLKSLDRMGSGALAERFEFNYYGGNLPDQSERNRLDHWGFLGSEQSEYIDGIRYELTDLERRKTNLNGAFIGSLKSIVYPTGLDREFIYENNEYFDSGYFVYQDQQVQRLCTDYYCPNDLIYSQNFTVSEEVEADFFMEYLNTNNGDDWITVRLEKDGEFYAEMTIDNRPGSNTTTYPRKILLTPGSYYMYAYNFNIQVDNDYSRDDFNVYLTIPLNPVLQSGRKGAGIRIKQILSKDGAEVLSEVNYQYDREDGFSSGKLLNKPIYTKEGKDPKVYWIPSNPEYPELGYWELDECYGTQVTDYNVADFSGNNIGYDRVTVINANGANGKEEHYFYNQQKIGNDVISDFLNAPKYAPFPSSTKNGLLLNKRVYKKTSGGHQLVEELENQYEFQTVSLPNGLFQVGTFNLGLLNSGGLCGAGTPYQLVDYRTNSGLNLLKSVTQTQKFDSSEITNVTEYDYESEKHLQPTKIETIQSDGKILTKKIKYTFDFALDSYPTGYSDTIRSGIYNEMLDQHLLAAVVETNLVDGKTSYSSITNHSRFDTLYLTHKLYSQKFDLTNGYEEILDPFSLQPSFRKELEYTYEDGRIVEVEKLGEDFTTYIWNSLEQLIVRVEKKDFESVKTFLGSDYDVLIDASSPKQNLETIKSNLRVNFPDAMVTTYTYDPLIGVTSISDPRGYTTYYEYDDLNRLKAIKDEQGYLVEEYKYNYKNQ